VKNSWAIPPLGGVAILALLGVTATLPPQAAFFISALAITLFPGIVITLLVAGAAIERDTFPERLALWFVMGIGLVSALGLLGLALNLRLSDLVHISIIGYGLIVGGMILKQARRRRDGSPTTKHHHLPVVSIVTAAVLIVAIGVGLITLITPRDYDDWFYLAYIKDYAAGARLGSEDAIFGAGNPVPSRIWFGAGLWVFEAIISRVTGIDAVACHQIYLPILGLAFAVLALYTLARQVFRTARAALIGCGLQVLFYLSSAFPYKSAGWMVFARMAQDKAVSCFVGVPVATALAVRLLRQRDERQETWRSGLLGLYWLAILASAIVHGMGPVWCGLFIVPLGLWEWYRTRTKGSARMLAGLLLPLAASAAILISARGAIRDFVIGPVPAVIEARGALSSLYLPGTPFSPGTDTTNPITWVFSEGFRILNPLFITRYPLAIAGLVLTAALIRYRRTSFAGRFLLAVTVPVLLILFTPMGISLAGWFMTPRLVFRLSWVFPWGMTVAFFLVRSRMRPVLTILALAAIVFVLGRGNPLNYGRSFSSMRDRNRPSADVEAAFAFLASEPSPQGVILASEATGRMIPAFLPDAYPVNFREFGPLSRERLDAIVNLKQIDGEFLDEIERYQVHYILIENRKPLEGALVADGAGFVPAYKNASYSVWRRDDRGCTSGGAPPR
jgi:hypothetical protein